VLAKGCTTNIKVKKKRKRKKNEPHLYLKIIAITFFLAKSKLKKFSSTQTMFKFVVLWICHEHLSTPSTPTQLLIKINKFE
jgi:hypothetical protein